MKKALYILPIFVLFLWGCGPSKYMIIQNRIDEGKLAEADSLSRELIKLNPNDAEAYYFQGLVLLRRGEIRGAVKSLKRSFKLTASAGAYFALAGIYLDEHWLDSAADCIDSASTFGSLPLNFGAVSREVSDLKALAEEFFSRGVDHYKSNQFRQAAVEFKEALAINAEFAEAEYYLNLTEGLILFHRKGEDAYWDAITHFGEAAVLKPKRGEPHYLMGVCYQKKDSDDFDNPIREYKKALELELSQYYKDRAKTKFDELLERKKKLEAFWGRD